MDSNEIILSFIIKKIVREIKTKRIFKKNVLIVKLI